MKRVERRGTLDSQNLASHLHAAPAAIHPSGAHQPAPGSHTNGRTGGDSQGSDRSVHRSDTIPVHPSAQPGRLGPTGTHILSQGGYARHDRDYDHGASPYHSSAHAHARAVQRGPTPPGIATLPGSSANEDEEQHPPRRVRDMLHKVNGSANGHGSGSGSSRSASASRSPRLHAKGASPRGSKSDSMDVDADGEDVDVDAEADEADADADADPDADAELLEAVDAAEAANATDEEWLKKEEA